MLPVRRINSPKNIRDSFCFSGQKNLVDKLSLENSKPDKFCGTPLKLQNFSLKSSFIFFSTSYSTSFILISAVVYSCVLKNSLIFMQAVHFFAFAATRTCIGNKNNMFAFVLILVCLECQKPKKFVTNSRNRGCAPTLPLGTQA